MNIKASLLILALTAACAAQPAAVDQALQRILQEANGRGLVVAEPPPQSTTSIPEADQISAEEEDPGAAIPS